MSFAIAAAGTGGHVYPGLAVGEALRTAGIDPDDVLFVGGSRLESTVYPDAGFPFFEVELRGLVRSMDARNLGIPFVVARAVAAMRRQFVDRGVKVVLGMGGYVTVPAGVAARATGAVLMVAEQNAHAGLGNRVASRLAAKTFTSFPRTEGLMDAQFVGNPVRRQISEFDREGLRETGLERYGFSGERPVVGVFGGSLGAGALNEAALGAFSVWDGPPISVVHLAGAEHAVAVRERISGAMDQWVVIDFEDRMDLFFAACDLVVSRAGGAVAELTATGTPSILVPGGFGSSGHQAANAAALEEEGAAAILAEPDLDRLGEVVAGLLSNPVALSRMRGAAAAIARPDAASVVAGEMIDAHG